MKTTHKSPFVEVYFFGKYCIQSRAHAARWVRLVRKSMKTYRVQVRSAHVVYMVTDEGSEIPLVRYCNKPTSPLFFSSLGLDKTIG